MSEFRTFALFPHKSGSGTSERISLRVKVATWVRPSGFDDESLICLTADADSPEELDGYIDELIDELQGLKQIARNKMR